MNNLKTHSAGLDPIVDIRLVPKNGTFLFRIKYASCKTRYLSPDGTNGNESEGATFSIVPTLVVDTFADLQAYEFKAETVVNFIVKVDESKSGRTNTFYTWTGEVLKWTPETDDVWQPTI